MTTLSDADQAVECSSSFSWASLADVVFGFSYSEIVKAVHVAAVKAVQLPARQLRLRCCLHFILMIMGLVFLLLVLVLYLFIKTLNILN